MSELFTDTWALVTGPSSGIGRAFAQALAAEGANLVLAARSKDKLDALAEELRNAHGRTVHVIPIDLAEHGAPEHLAAEVDRLDVDIDHLVNNAGFGLWGPFTDGDAARLSEMVRLNCEALTALSRAFLPGMVLRRRGGVMHIASLAGLQPLPYMATYGATKAYVIALSLALAEEMRPQGVRVLAVCPGPVPTGFQEIAGFPLGNLTRLGAMSAEDVVRRSLEAYEEGRDLIVPGAASWLTSLTSRLLPRKFVVRAFGSVMRRRGSL